MKVILSDKTLDENVALLNDFLTQKGMSQIFGGKNERDEPEWGNTNYCESTRPIRPRPRPI